LDYTDPITSMKIGFRSPTAGGSAPPRLSFALSCSEQAPCGAGGA